MSHTGAKLTAVLGPTNTGKTHLAVERLCAHTGGMIGFPLRLLAREVYERVVKIKGAAQVALLTGEERIVPAGARYFLCTAESMPTDRTFPFVAIDEGQMGADPERGHVFTNAMLHIRGTSETMILGSETLRPVLKRLLPDAHIITRPRFSKLSFIEPKKLSRLPSRCAIVAFTAENVYALAEMLRRHKGGAAVVMGGLSPRTRNAQVAMYQAGEVDYLVATDAIGMGLNMDITHVAFAGLSKFDGRKHRRLFPSEMAQIAGRAGRHQRDGTFGTIQMGKEDETGSPTLTEDEIKSIENHGFAPIPKLVWRNARLDFTSLPRLISSLEERPTSPDLWRSDDAIDLQVLKLLAAESWVQERAKTKPMVMRLWAACGLPDYRKTGPKAHATLVGRMYRHLSEGRGRIPAEWIRAELAALDNVAGDIGILSDRIAAARTWTYVTHRSDWLHEADQWADKARTVEDKLSDALHQRLMQRFVDRRTSVLLKDLKMRDQILRVEVDADGSVVVEGANIGTLHGFAFTPDPTARAGERKMLLAAAERHLATELTERATQLLASEDNRFTLDFDGTAAATVSWDGHRVATLRKGKDALSPTLVIERALDILGAPLKQQVQERVQNWFEQTKSRHLLQLVRLENLKATVSGPARGLIVQLVEMLGCLPRTEVASLMPSLTREDRRALGRAGVKLGASHIFVNSTLKPEPTRWRLALWALANDLTKLPELPPAGATLIRPDRKAPAGFYTVAGFWAFQSFALRLDMADRLSLTLHEQRMAAANPTPQAETPVVAETGEAAAEATENAEAAPAEQPAVEAAKANEGRKPRKPNDRKAVFQPDPQLATSLGLTADEFKALMIALGFRGGEDRGFAFVPGRGPQKREPQRKPDPTREAASPFAGLADMFAKPKNNRG